LAYETVLDQLPQLAELLESNGQSLEDRLQDIPTLMDDIMRANPEADRATIARTLNAADSQIQLYRQEAELSQRLLRSSYEDFSETFVSDAVSDMAIQSMSSADDLKSYFETMPLDRTFVYDEEANTISITTGEGDESSREAAKIVILQDMLSVFPAQASTLKDAGIDPKAAMLEITQQLFGIESAEAEEMLELASSVEVKDATSATTADGRRRMGSTNPGPEGYTGQGDFRTGPAPGGSLGLEETGIKKISTDFADIIKNEIVARKEKSAEILESRSNINYSMDVTSVALGDDKKGTRSKLILNELKGKDLSAYANSNIIVPAGTEGNINTVGDLLGENIGLAQIADVRFTQVPTASGMQAGVVLQLKKATGADRDAELGASSVTMLYDDVISSFDPTMQSKVTNEFDNPGMQLTNDALSLMINIPGAVSPEDGVTFNKNINGTDLEITMFPIIREMGDDNLGIIAGISRVHVKSSGVDGEPLEENYALAVFIEKYNELKAQNNR
jgi:hypothetical protein